MEIKARLEGNIVIFDLGGVVDSNSANFVEAVGQCIRDGYTDILCNFSEVESIDYMGMSAIVLAYKEVLNHHGRLKFTGVPAHLRNLLSVTGVDRVIESYRTEELALAAFKEDKVIEDIKKLQLRRRFKRLPIDIKIKLRGSSVVSCVNADILNLSGVGAYIYGCDKFKLGDEVAITLRLTPDKQEMELYARVVWLCDKLVQQQVFPGIGVEFNNISSGDQEKIVQFVERNLSFLPTDD
jgi:anti-anti-sigma factor